MLNQVTIHQLELFLVAAKLKNFSRAADQMAISQPAFSAQIIKLESILNAPLFERIGRRIDLTEIGAEFEKYARATLQTLREGKQAIDDMSSHVVGPLRIGASTTVANYILPRYLKNYRSEHPEARAQMLVDNSAQIEQALLRNEIDMGIVEAPVRNKRFNSCLFRKDRLVVIFHPDHKWGSRKFISLDEFKKAPVLARERGSGTRKVFMEMVGEEHFEQLDIVMELGDTEAIKKGVIEGIGVAVVSEASVEAELKSGELRSVLIEKNQFDRAMTILILRNRYISNPIRSFLAILAPLEKPTF